MSVLQLLATTAARLFTRTTLDDQDENLIDLSTHSILAVPSCTTIHSTVYTGTIHSTLYSREYLGSTVLGSYYSCIEYTLHCGGTTSRSTVVHNPVADEEME